MHRGQDYRIPSLNSGRSLTESKSKDLECLAPLGSLLHNNQGSLNRQELPAMRENFPVWFWKAHGHRRSFDKPAVMDRSDLVTTFSSFSVICLQYWRSALRLRSSLHQPVSAKASPSCSADVAIGFLKALGLRLLQPLAATRRRGWHSVTVFGYRSEDPYQSGPGRILQFVHFTPSTTIRS